MVSEHKGSTGVELESVSVLSSMAVESSGTL